MKLNKKSIQRWWKKKDIVEKRHKKNLYKAIRKELRYYRKNGMTCFYIKSAGQDDEDFKLAKAYLESFGLIIVHSNTFFGLEVRVPTLEEL